MKPFINGDNINAKIKIEGVAGLYRVLDSGPWFKIWNYMDF